MSLRDDLLPTVQGARELLDGFGMRQTRVLIRKRVYAERTGKGGYTDTDTEILPRPKVKEIVGIGAIGRGEFQVSRITPDNTVGGYTPAELLLEQPKGTFIFAVLVGPGVDRVCKIIALNVRKNFEYVMTLEDAR